MKGVIKFEFSFDEDEEEEVPDPDGIVETLHAMLRAEVAKAGLAPTLTIGEFRLEWSLRDGACERCGTPVTEGRCEDETCPFSDYPQGDRRGWADHPDAPPRDRPYITKMGKSEIEFSDGGCIEAPDDDGTIRRRDAHGNCEEIRRIGDDHWAHWAGMFNKTEKDFEQEEDEE